MRFWAWCAQHPDPDPGHGDSGSIQKKKSAAATATAKPKVGVTVFLGDEDASADFSYSCPAWARTRYSVAYAQRAPGRPGLLAWQRPEIIAAGVRGLAAALAKTDSRLRPQPSASPTAQPGQAVVAAGNVDNGSSARTSTALEAPATNPSGAQQQQQLAPPPPASSRGGDVLYPHREISDETAVGSHDSVAPEDKSPSAPASPAAEARPEADTRDAAAENEQKKGKDVVVNGKGANQPLKAGEV